MAEFYLAPDHDAGAVRAALRNVALTSNFLDHRRLRGHLEGGALGHYYKLHAYPFDIADQFQVGQ